MENMPDLPKIFPDMLFHCFHLFYGINLRPAALLRGPERALLFGPVRKQEYLEIFVLFHQMIDQAHMIIQSHQHRIQTGQSAVRVVPFQPPPLLKPARQPLQPVCAEAGHTSLVHLEYQIKGLSVYYIRELGKRPVWRILLWFRPENIPEPFQSFPIDGNAGNGPLLLIGIFIQALLEIPVGSGIDPVVFHPLQRLPGLDLSFERQELMIARLQLKAVGHGLQCSGFIAGMGPQLGRLQPDPWIIRFLPDPLFCIIQCLLQPAAVHQGHRVPVVPCGTAPGVFL